MLKELNTIANGLLGLHGYPQAPVAWAEIFAARVRTPMTASKPGTRATAENSGCRRTLVTASARPVRG